MKNIKQIAATILHEKIPELSLEEITNLIENPKNSNYGDLAFPCFELSRLKKKAPSLLAKELADEIKSTWLKKAEPVGPYINFFFQQNLVQQHVVNTIIKEQKNYGQLSFGQNETVVLDLSSPNIAKPFSMGHLRSTVIGNSIANILEKCGYQTVRINYLGDWGTQFGKLITAYLKWGSEVSVRNQPIPELLKLYVKFHEEAEMDPMLVEEGRKWFKKLEDGNEEAHSLWEWFRKESLLEFQKIYELLGVSFDSTNGEAFYNDKMDPVIQLLKEQDLITKSDGAEVVMLDETPSLPPCLIKKSDGATLYATRDLAAALYRRNTYHFSKALYVVGQEQAVHFQQIKAVMKKLGFEWADDMHHISFGLLLKEGKKMSTRKGKVVLLESVINEAIQLAEQNIMAKNPELSNKKQVAKQVGVGAIIFHDLKNYRVNSIEFSLQDMLKFEGETGPYVQYTFARACSILRKAAWIPKRLDKGIEDDYSWELTKLLHDFPTIIEKSYVGFDPSAVAKYIVDVCQSFNRWYGQVKFLHEDEEKETRLSLIYATTLVIEECLRLLGMDAPKEM